MSKLTSTEQLKALRDDVRKIGYDVSGLNSKVSLIENRLKSQNTDLSDMRKEFFDLDQKLEKWKSELFDKIDNGYITRWRDQELEHAAIQSQLDEINRKLDISTN